jgi:hypothetical protein
MGATILLHRNNIARAAHKKQDMLTVFFWAAAIRCL